MKNEYGFWNHKYDFAEINKYNWRLVLKDNFQLNIKKITLLSMLFAVEIILTIFSKYVIGGLLIMGFYTIELSFFGILFIYLCSNIVYSTIINILVNFMRIALPLGSDIVGVVAMTLSDLSFLIAFAVIFFFLKRTLLFRAKSHNKMKYYLWIIVISGILATFISASLSFLYNQTFIFEWYRTFYPSLIPQKNSVLWFSILFVGFGVTIAKFICNLLLFTISVKIIVNLINKNLF
ncbi:ECF transporter S component [Spiroplasma endosymbiont of Atherix ibis]|uniref:ECF transporter S component n=1 Tax=Spiroplasma endosymbiont of Atherix ibis TaxID=3066291 RepID=UPI0030CA8353